jgi:hypothetical protein
MKFRAIWVVPVLLLSCDDADQPGTIRLDAGNAAFLSDRGVDSTGDGFDPLQDALVDATPPDPHCANNSVRSCFTGPRHLIGVGACREGEQVCWSGRWLGPCSGERLPSAEQCDGIDNDCNGRVDDGPDTVCVVGACRATVPFCASCASLRAQPERCDGVDNNCDGMIDGPAADTSCRSADDPHRRNFCRDGRCVTADACDLDWAQCPGTSTCGTNLRTSPDHCARCGQACTARVCFEGRCPMPTRVDSANYGGVTAISTVRGSVYICGSVSAGFDPSARPPFPCMPVAGLEESSAFVRLSGVLCALRRDGRVSCFAGTMADRAVFRDVLGLNDAVDIVRTLGRLEGSGFALRATGEVAVVQARGSDVRSAEFRTVPVATFPQAVRLFPASANHVCFGTREGAAECYRVGSGASPQRVELPPESIAVSYDSESFSCALLRSGRVTCWGSLSVSPPYVEPRTPLPGVDMGVAGIRQITTNLHAACATQGRGGGTWCWGNLRGLNGSFDGPPRGVGFPPTRIAGFDDMDSVLLANNHRDMEMETLLGITARYAVICLGRNSFYACGPSLDGSLRHQVLWGVE